LKTKLNIPTPTCLVCLATALKGSGFFMRMNGRHPENAGAIFKVCSGWTVCRECMDQVPLEYAQERLYELAQSSFDAPLLNKAW